MRNNNYAEPLLFSSLPGPIALVTLRVRNGSYGHVANRGKCVATRAATLKSDFWLKLLNASLDTQNSPKRKY
jgi:hypothetical protein